MQDQIFLPNQSRNFEMVGVDIWNGSASELAEFQFVTQVKFPLLQKGQAGDLPWGLGTENIVLVDPGGIVRGVYGAGVEARDEITAMIGLINNPSPLSELRPKSLYYGLTGEVGSELKITVTVKNTGLTDLEVTGIRSSTDEVSVDRTSFSVPPGGSEKFTTILKPSKEGTLTGSVEVITNEKNWTLQISPIEISGGLPPAISLPTLSADYGSLEVGRATSRTFEVRNDGLGPLTVTDVACDLEGVTISERAFTLAAGASRTITVTIQPSAEGAFAGAVRVLSDDPDRAEVSLDIAGSARIIPADSRVDFDANGSVDFLDFLSFANAFGTSDALHDVDANGTVDFTDFLVFVENFGRAVQ